MSAIAGEHTEAASTGMLTKTRLRWLAYAMLGGVIAFVGARYGDEYWSVGRFIENTDDAYAGGQRHPDIAARCRLRGRDPRWRQ